MGDYPGADYHMSLYGAREHNPQEAAGLWKEKVKTEDRIHDKHIAIRGNGTAVWPGEPVKGVPGSYFDNTKKNVETISVYDRMFHATSDYDSRLRRDDRQHAVGLDVQAEERLRKVPVCSSSVYGRLVEKPLDDVVIREHVRTNCLMKGFYKTGGTGIPTAASLRSTNHTQQPS